VLLFISHPFLVLVLVNYPKTQNTLILVNFQEWCELYEKMFPSKDSATARTKSSKFLIDDQFKDEGKIMQKVCGDFPSSFLYKYTQHKDFFSAIYS
jgi:hypothetical protein